MRRDQHGCPETDIITLPLGTEVRVYACQELRWIAEEQVYCFLSQDGEWVHTIHANSGVWHRGRLA